MPWAELKALVRAFYPIGANVYPPVGLSVMLRDYNERKPHSSLNYMTPAEFAAKKSRGRDVDSVHVENALGVSHFPATAAAS